MKKLTQDHVASIFIKEGCVLLSLYVNMRTKVKYQCDCGNIAFIIVKDFQYGKRCGCGNIKIGIKRRLDINSVKKYFIDKGCEMLQNEYVNGHTPISYKCGCGNVSKISFSSFKTGRRCKTCGFKKLQKPLAKLNAQMKKKCNSALRTSLLYTGQKKDARTRDLLGYGVKDLREHIINHPNWNSVKNGKWHLDHIFPIKAFVKYGIFDLKLINSLDNLQPLEALENMSKQDKYDVDLFKIYLAKKGVVI